MLNKWQTFLDELQGKITSMAFQTYFESTKFISEENGVVTFSVRNSLTKNTIEKKYGDKILEALKEAGFKCEEYKVIIDDKPKKTGIRQGIEVSTNNEPIKKTPISTTISKGSSFQVTGSKLNPRYTLDNYVVGSNNNVAVNAARAIIENPGQRWNPFFLYGGSGFGKTHLIQAIGNELQKTRPDLKILYVTIEEFYHDFVTAMKNKVDGFQDKYRKLDVLIVDDFQFIQGKDASQAEFFHTFNELYESGKQVIVASDKLPTEIGKVDTRLASRLTMGVALDIQLPDFETRCAILKAKAEMLGSEIDDTTVEYIAENFNTNIRELEGALNNILLLAEMNNTSTSDMLQQLEPVVPSNRRHCSSRQLIDKVAKYYNLSSKDLLGTSRTKDIKNARQIAMYLMNEELGLSTTKIGTELSKDHTTIMHGIKRIKTNLQSDFNLREQVSELRSKLYAS